MTKFKLISLIVLVALIIGAIGFLYKTGRLNQISLLGSKINTPKLFIASPDILYLTSPVFTFTGKIEKISGDKLTISNQAMIPGDITSKDTNQTVTKKLTYTVSIGPNTSIQLSNNSSVSPVPPKRYTAQDLKIGQTVSATSNKDLRMLLINEFEATSISVQVNSISISGTVTGVTSDYLTIKNELPLPGSTGAKGNNDMKIIINSQTVIGSPSLPGSTPAKQLSLADIAVGKQLLVSADLDTLSGNQITALTILPFTPPNQPTTATNSSTIKTK